MIHWAIAVLACLLSGIIGAVATAAAVIGAIRMEETSG